MPDGHCFAVTMPVLPKSFLTLGAGILTARMGGKLRRKDRAPEAQQKALAHLARSLAATEQGRSFGIEAGITAAQYARRVPLRTYEDYLPQIERMRHGAADVLWPGACAFYAVSAGTTAGRPKLIPVTEGMLKHFRRAGLASLLYYTSRVGHAGVFRGRHLLLGGSTALTRLPEGKAFAGSLGGIAALNLPRWLESHLYEPGPAIAAQPDGPARFAAIAAHTVGRDLSLLAAMPHTLLTLAAAVQQHIARGNARAANLQGVWPNLECVVHGGVPVGPFLEELRRACGPGVNFHEVYPATEGLVAAQDAEAARGLRLIADAGIYYEFLPLKDFDETRLSILGPKAVPLPGVQTGVDYVLLMTTPAGLCRYVLGDIVRFVSTAPPRFVHVGRTGLRLDALGERVTEQEITDALLQVCSPHDWTIVNFHVAPLLTPSLTGQHRGRHEWWVELKPGTVDTPTGPLIAASLDTGLQQRNADYAARRKSNLLEPPVVRLVMPGVFDQWLRQNGRWSGSSKMPRCRSDREVADVLAQIARFTADD
jgi:hypothetical protein